MPPRDSPAASPEWRISPISGPVGQTNPQRYRFGFGCTGGRKRAKIRHKPCDEPLDKLRRKRPALAPQDRRRPRRPNVRIFAFGPAGSSERTRPAPQDSISRAVAARKPLVAAHASRAIPPEPSKKERIGVRPAVLPCARASLARAPRARPSAPLAAVPTAPARGTLSQTLGLAAPTWRP